MDPLSVGASVAGLFTLTVQLINAVESIVRSVKTQPTILLNISQELAALQLVLERLEKSLVSRKESSTEDEALIAVLNGCKGTYHNIGKELALLQQNLKKNRMVKLYMQMTFTSRIKALDPLRDQLEKYKATLIIALHLRTLETSPEDLRREISNLRVDLNVMNTRPAPHESRLAAIQQYLMTTTKIVARGGVDFDSSSQLASPKTPNSSRDLESATMSSSTTLVPRSSSSSIFDPMDSPKPELNTFQSFQDWLGTFAPNTGESNQQSGASDIEANIAARRLANAELQGKEKPVHPGALASLPDVTTTSSSFAQTPEEVLIKITISDSSDTSILRAEEITCKKHAQLYEVIEKLYLRGYTDVCGFKIEDSTSVGPITAFESAWPIFVTSGPSNYTFEDGLLINQHESLAEFYDNLLTIDRYTKKPRSSFSVDSNVHGLTITDLGLSQTIAKVPGLTITFDRTLRVPEDGETYHLPAILGTLPVLLSHQFRHRLPGMMGQKGGVLIPLYQREALVLSFHNTDNDKSDDRPNYAIKIFAGSVNAISGGLATHPDILPKQDYIVAPSQQRLDGFCSDKGLVKQFVAMPIGSDYTAESQLTGKEFIGGIQLQIAQQFKGIGHFSLEGHQIHYGSLEQSVISAPDSLDRLKTPHELGLEPGRRIFVEGKEIIAMSKSLLVDKKHAKTLTDKRLFPKSETKCRATFVHELYARAKHQVSLMPTTINITAIKPLSITIKTGLDKREPGSNSTYSKSLEQYYSQFLDVVDFKQQVFELSRSPGRYVYLNGIIHDDSPRNYDPIENYNLDGGLISFSESYLSAPDEVFDTIDVVRSGKLTSATWEMGLAAGGGIRQVILEDTSPHLWNWKKSVLVNVQMLNTVAYESVTGMKAPPCPISIQDYIKGRLPFYHIIQTSQIEGSANLNAIRTVGEIDSSIKIPVGVSMRKDSGPSCCAVCQKSLCDSIVQPCHHIFCYNCVQAYMMGRDDTPASCAACLRIVTGIIEFSAPMEFPSVKTEPKFKAKLADRDSDQSQLQTQNSFVESTRTAHSIRDDGSGSDDAAQESLVEQIEQVGGKELSIGDPATKKGGRTALQMAAENGQLKDVHVLLEAGSSPNEDAAIEDGLTSLQAASKAGKLEVVKILIASGADINAPPCLVNGWTVLQAASLAGHEEVVRYVVQKGADIQVLCCQPPNKILEHGDCPGFTAIDLAAQNGKETVVGFLLEMCQLQGLTINLDLGLLLAAKNGHYNVVKRLLSEGANARSGEKAKTTPLHEAARHGHVDIAKLLLISGADVYSRLEGKVTATYLASKSNRKELVHLLMSQYNYFKRPVGRERSGMSFADWRKQYEQEALFEPALHLCARDGDEPAVCLLLDAGFDPDGNSKHDEETPIFYAAERGHTKIIEVLLDRGAKLVGFEPRRDSYVITPLHLAAQEGHVETLKFLMSRGMPHKTPHDDGYEALHAAAYHGRDAVVKVLVDAGANPNAATTYNETPLHHAADGGSETVVRLLLSYGVDPVAQNDRKRTPLHLAADNLEIVQRLLDLGADPNHHDCDELTPLHHAVGRGCLASVKLLLERGGDPHAQNRWGENMFHTLISYDYDSLYGSFSFLNTDKQDCVISKDELEARRLIACIFQQQQVDINAAAGFRAETPLEMAVKKRNIEMINIFLDLGAQVTRNSIIACGDIPDTVQLLLERGYKFTTTTEGARILLYRAAENGWVDVIRLVVKFGVSVNIVQDSKEMDRCCRQRRTTGAHPGAPGKTPLHKAAASGHLAAVAMLMDLGADPKIREENGETGLHWAVANKHSRVVWYLIEHGAEINVSGPRGTALQIACKESYTEIARMLLRKDAAVNAPITKTSGTALQEAAWSGSAEIVRLLLEKNADVNAVEGIHGSPLHAAMIGRNFQVVKMLLDHGANVNAVGGTYGGVLQAASACCRANIVQLVLDQHVDINACDQVSDTALIAAASEGHYEVVCLLLAQGADVNAQGRTWDNALNAALARLRNKNINKRRSHILEDEEQTLSTTLNDDSIRIVKTLLENGANVNASCGRYGTPIQLATIKGHEEIVRMLIERGADMEAEQEEYGSALNESVIEGHTEICRLLISRGADCTSPDRHGHTAMHHAAQRGHCEILETLLAFNAPSITCKNCGRTPVHLAAARGHTECLKILREKAIDINGADKHGQTPLQQALASYHKEAVEFLISNGAQLDVYDSFGRTVLDWAVSMGAMDIIDLLGVKAKATPDEEQHRLRVKAIQDIGIEFKKSSFSDPSLLYHLGHCLLLMDDLPTARTALYESMYLNLDNPFSVFCTCCCVTVSRIWYVCKSCPEMDICVYCFEAYYGSKPSVQYVPLNQIDKFDRPVHPMWCQGHDFVMISRENAFKRTRISSYDTDSFSSRGRSNDRGRTGIIYEWSTSRSRSRDHSRDTGSRHRSVHSHDYISEAGDSAPASDRSRQNDYSSNLRRRSIDRESSKDGSEVIERRVVTRRRINDDDTSIDLTNMSDIIFVRNEINDENILFRRDDNSNADDDDEIPDVTEQIDVQREERYNSDDTSRVQYYDEGAYYPVDRIFGARIPHLVASHEESWKRWIEETFERHGIPIEWKTEGEHKELQEREQNSTEKYDKIGDSDKSEIHEDIEDQDKTEHCGKIVEKKEHKDSS